MRKYHKFTEQDINIIKQEISKTPSNIRFALLKAASIIYKNPKLLRLKSDEALRNCPELNRVRNFWYRNSKKESSTLFILVSPKVMKSNRKVIKRGAKVSMDKTPKSIINALEEYLCKRE